MLRTMEKTCRVVMMTVNTTGPNLRIVKKMAICPVVLVTAVAMLYHSAVGLWAMNSTTLGMSPERTSAAAVKMMEEQLTPYLGEREREV